LFTLHNISYSQSSLYKEPKLIFELSGSFDAPVLDASGEVKDFFTFKNYGTVYGIGFHFKMKYGIKKNSGWYPYITIGFRQLQNDDNNNAFIDSNNIINGYPLQGSQTYNLTTGSSVLFLRDLNAGAGIQYMFRTNHTIIPYLGFEINYHNIWGAYVQKPNAPLGNNSSEMTTFDINSSSRLGLGADVGFDYRVTNNLGFVFGTSFHLANLLGKSSERTGASEKNKMNLLDKSDSDLNSLLNKNRNLTYFEFYIGFVLLTGKL
jgi:hypothetical protein